MIHNPFLFGFQASTGLGENEARDAWLEFSRDLSEPARKSIEVFGYAEGHYQGTMYLKIHLKQKGGK